MESETNSIKSHSGSLSSKTKNLPTGTKKQVDFKKTRPKLIIPSPSVTISQQPTATTQRTAHTPIYNRKNSVFAFDQFHGLKDFTKSGLDVGEKCSLWCYNKVRSWSRKWFTHMFLSIVLILYTIGGALMFEFIEGQNETRVEKNLHALRHKLVWDLRNLSIVMPEQTSWDEWEGTAVRKLRDYEITFIDWYNNHKLIVGNTKDKRWSFGNAIVFCGTIYTSIGYGHIYPETRTGKILTIVYAIIGIPLFLLALTDFGKFFTRCIKFFWSFVRRVYYTGSCRRVRKTAHVKEIFKGAQMMYEIATFRRPSAFVDPENVPPDQHTSTAITDETPTPAISNFEIDDEFNLPISLAIFILIVYILLGGLIYWIWEDWDFFDSFYFVFISMSTVGFGDMVPDNVLCMIVSIVYLVFGLALMSMCINVVQLKLSDTFKQASSKLGATMGIDVDDEDGTITTVPPDNIEMPKVHEANNKHSENENNENTQIAAADEINVEVDDKNS